MKKLTGITLLVVFSILLVDCAPQVVVVPAPPQQQQQQEQNVIINPPAVQQPPAVVVPYPVPVPAPSGWCGSLRGSYLNPGMVVHVSSYPDLRNNIKRGPYASSEYMGQIPVGGKVLLLDGPYCDNGKYIYWHVEILNRDAIYDRQFPKKQYKSVYTAETDISGVAWLVQ